MLRNLKLRGFLSRRIYQYLATITGTINTISSGLHYGWTSPTLPQLLQEDSQIPLTKDQGSWVAVAYLLGIGCGSIFSIVMLDKIGRKNVLLMTSPLFFIPWVMIATTHSVEVLLLARVIGGIGDGSVFCAAPVYLAEIADPDIRGLLSSSIMISVTWGYLLISILGAYLSIAAAAMVCSIFPLMGLLTFWWMPKSPYFLLMKNNVVEATRSLKKFKGTDDVSTEFNRIQQAVEEQNANAGKWLDLIKVKANRKSTGIILAMVVFQQCSGIGPFILYLQTILEEADSNIEPTFSIVILFSIQIICTILSSVVIDRIGRKPLLIVSVGGAGLCLLVESWYYYIKGTGTDTSQYSSVPIAALICFVMMYSFGVQTIPALLCSELFPTNVKSLASSLNIISFAIAAAVAVKFFQFASDEFGMQVPFFVFALCCGLGVIFIIFVVPETKGKTLEEIQQT